jgi:hypothetical protein
LAILEASHFGLLPVTGGAGAANPFRMPPDLPRKADMDLISLLHSRLPCVQAGCCVWLTAVVIVANSAFDGLDHGCRSMLRKVIAATAGFQAALLGIATGAALLSNARAAAIVAGVSALGFLSNVWTLAPRRDKAPEGLKKKNSTQRVVAVALTLVMTMAPRRRHHGGLQHLIPPAVRRARRSGEAG